MNGPKVFLRGFEFASGVTLTYLVFSSLGGFEEVGRLLDAGEISESTHRQLTTLGFIAYLVGIIGLAATVHGAVGVLNGAQESKS